MGIFTWSVDYWLFATKWHAQVDLQLIHFFLHHFKEVKFIWTIGEWALKPHKHSAGGSMLRTRVLTFLSGGSRGLQLFARSWWSSSNLRLMFSMESWSMSQKPARSEATGRGWALGFCQVRNQVKFETENREETARQSEMPTKRHRLFQIMSPNTFHVVRKTAKVPNSSVWPLSSGCQEHQ